MDEREALAEVKKDRVHSVQLWFTDIHGSLKYATIPHSKLEESLDRGTWFDGSSIQGFTRIEESDMFLKPDPSTYAVLPWSPEDRRVARFIADVYIPGGKQFEGDPRRILKRAVEKAKRSGFVYNVGPELEFFLLKDKDDLGPTVHDSAGYFDASPSDLAEKVKDKMTDCFGAFGLELEMAHHEVAPGQHEIDFKYGDAVTQADRAITFKQIAKSVAADHDLIASFMPKPFEGMNGSGMHVHQSLFRNGKNTFYDEKNKHKLSDVARSFIAGQLTHIKEISAIVAPTINSYRRLVPGFEAPVYILWSQMNRSALIRVPHYSPGREQSTRAELRCPDPSCNPYLAFASMLGAGLKGVQGILSPPKPIDGNVYEFSEKELRKHKIETLPESLGEAIRHFRDSKLAREVLGQHTFDAYLAAKRTEYDKSRLHVPPRERDIYLRLS